MLTDPAPLLSDIAAVTGIELGDAEWSPAAGGDINQAGILASGNQQYFLKLNAPSFAEVFAAEAEGLAELAASQTVRVPEVVGYGATDTSAWLLLEALSLSTANTLAAEQFGYVLAEMHRHTAARFGWHRDNVIGATPQCNTQHDDWPSFWREERLRPQLQAAGMLEQAGDFLAAVDTRLVGHKPEPSLLHGDLWGGNWGMLEDATPVIFDPAVYYGDRETDLAMTHLFGGFSDRFYAAYNEAWPLQAGLEMRRDLYNLYHVLNHYNLFGGGYRAQAETIIQRLSA